MSDLSGGMEGSDLPLMEVREVKTVEIVVVTSDRGLCGSFNANIIKTADRLRKHYEAEGKKVSFVTVGKKGTQVFQENRQGCESISMISWVPSRCSMPVRSRKISPRLFLMGKAIKSISSTASFIPLPCKNRQREELLPIKPVTSEEGGVRGQEPKYPEPTAYEPDPGEIMEVLLPLFLNVQIYHAMLEVGASEHAARMTAMDNATNACKDMIKQLTQLYNKARQAAVTGELMDIVGGAEALKG